MRFDDARIVIHIGPHKTGTTWLQHSVFPRLPRVSQPFSLADVRRLVVFPDQRVFDPRSIHEELQARNTIKGETILISDERLAGAPLAGGYDREALADRLLSTFPGARIVISTREQRAAIASLYKHYVTWNSGTARPSEFLYQRAPLQAPSFNLAYFDYDYLFDVYAERFTHDRVFVAPLELSAVDADRYLATFANACGVKSPKDVSFAAQNRGMDDRLVPLMRLANMVTRQSEHDLSIASGSYPIIRGPGRDLTRRILRRLSLSLRPSDGSHLAATINRLVGDYFQPSNQTLEARLKMSLASLGYPT